ncbi:MAG: DUF255 domain-containing protein [Pseudomonadales bacterium]|nr:DUF255 domain-containing protein [Pseudomonadales bacterium]
MIGYLTIRQRVNKWLLVSLLIMVALPVTSFAEPVELHAWSDEVFQKGKDENKLILLDLVADWCQFCIKMEETTYKDESVTSTLNKGYLVVKADEADYPELAEKYKNDGRPTTVIFNPDGTQIIKRVGYIKPQWMNWMLQAIAQNPTSKTGQL